MEAERVAGKYGLRRLGGDAPLVCVPPKENSFGWQTPTRVLARNSVCRRTTIASFGVLKHKQRVSCGVWLPCRTGLAPPHWSSSSTKVAGSDLCGHRAKHRRALGHVMLFCVMCLRAQERMLLRMGLRGLLGENRRFG